MSGEMAMNGEGAQAETIQEQLAAAVRMEYPDAVIKKINDGRYVDIHLPTIHPRQGTHLFFNTAKNQIRCGFFVRDGDFVEAILAATDAVERYTDGLRPVGNPAFSTVLEASAAAVAFLGRLNPNGGARSAAHTGILTLLGQDDINAVRQGISLLQSLGDPNLWSRFAAGVSVDEQGELIIASESELQALVKRSFRTDIAFLALRETGQLVNARKLNLGGCQMFTDLSELHGLTDLQTLSLAFCDALTSLRGIDACTGLQSLDLSGCDNLTDLGALRALPALTALSLRSRDALTSLAALPALPALKSLDVGHCSELTSLDGLTAFPALEEIHLNGCDGLTSLNGLPPTIEIAGFDGALALDGLTTLSDRAAAAVASSEGKLSLGGLTALSESAAKILAGHSGELVLNGLTTLSDTASLVLAGRVGGLALGGLTSLPDGVAAALAGHKGHLQLDRLTTLSDTVAAVLARHEGPMSLDGLHVLSTAATAAFAALHSGELSLKQLRAPLEADEILGRHSGRVALGRSFQYITVGIYEDPDAIETNGRKVEATPLRVSVDEESTFTLGYDRCGPSEDVVGVIAEEAICALLEDTGDWTWHEHDGILHRYGLTYPATELLLPDGSFESIALRHWPRSYDIHQLALSGSEEGDFVHVTQSSEKARTWDSWKRYSLTLTEGTFDLGCVLVNWDDGIVTGYTYVDDDIEEDFEEDDSFSTSTSGIDTSFFFNNGKQLVPVDFEELRGELEDAGIEPADVAAVRSYLLAREPEAANSAIDDAPINTKTVLTRELAARHVALEFMETFAASLSLDSAPPKINLRDYDSLTEGAATVLASQSTRELRLDWVTTLSQGAAKAFAAFRGDVFLNGLTTLSEHEARALARHQGQLSLSGLTSLSERAAKCLAQHDGEVTLSTEVAGVFNQYRVLEDSEDDVEEPGDDIDAILRYLTSESDEESDEFASDEDTYEEDSDEEDTDEEDTDEEDTHEEDTEPSEEVQLVANHLEVFGFRPDSSSWLRNVLKGYDSGAVPTVDRKDLGMHYSRIRSVVQLTNGMIVSSADEGALRFWDPSTLRCIRSVDTGASLGMLLALSDGYFLADVANTCTVWEADADAPICVLDHGDSTLVVMYRLSETEIVTEDNSGVIRVWDTTTWAVRSTRRFEGLGSCAVLDKNHLLLQSGEYTDCGFVCTDTIWNVRTDTLWQDTAPPFGPRSSAILNDGRWATTDGGNRVFIRNALGSLVQTIDLPLRPTDVWEWGASGDSTQLCGYSGIASLPSDELVIWGTRQGDASFVLLRCDVKTGSCKELFVEPREEDSSVSFEKLPIGPHGLLVRLPPADGEVRVLHVPADSTVPLRTLIAPRGRRRPGFEHFDTTDDHDPRGALALQDGRLLTWGWVYDHALRLWSSDGAPAGTIGTVSRFWNRDPLENTLLGVPE